MLTIQHRYELASRACVQAVAAEGGVNIAIEDYEFDYKHDGSFKRLAIRRNNKIVPTGLPLEFQLKASTEWREDAADIVYNLDAATYNHLVEQNAGAGAPKILILFCLPISGDGWVDVSHDAVQLKKSCYWMLIRGEPTDATTTKVIRIPRTQLLNAANLLRLLEWVNEHEVTPPTWSPL